MTQIKDLGFEYTSETKKYKKRFGIYECPYCNQHFRALSTHIQQGNIKSCGCLKKINIATTKHGMANKCRLYTIWKNMRQRCLNQNNISFINYGGRGITICDDWLDDFMSFYDWAIKKWLQR